MIEIQPQVIYDPNGVLSIRTELNDEPQVESRQLDLLEQLSDSPGVNIDNKNTIHVEIKSAFGSNFGYARDGSISNFLSTVGLLIPSFPKDDIDRVMLPKFLSPRGFMGATFPHMQRFLNTQIPLDERVARDTLFAMAVPLGKEKEQHAKREFNLYGQHATARFFDIAIYDETFGVRSSTETDDSHIENSGRVDWNWVNLSTLGSCACLGANGDDRQRIYLDSSRGSELYEMTPHSIDFPQQSLSLLLGVGALAYHANQYAGREDILANAAWDEPRVYPGLYPDDVDQTKSSNLY